MKFPLSLVLFFFLCASVVAIPALAAEPIPAGLHAPHHHPHGDLNSWEGSAVGKAYSEFNHHLAGLFVVIIALAEVIPVIGIVGYRLRERGRQGLRWIGFLLPTSLLLTGLFLIIWSDHEGWPIGARTLVQTYFGDDWEMIQHKLFGITLLAVGVVESFRRAGWLQHPGWRLPLPGLAIVGGVSLFLHSHGSHPAAHQIAIHHAVMGAMAVTAGTSKIASIWKRTSGLGRWEMLWGALVLLIGLQLLIYSE